MAKQYKVLSAADRALALIQSKYTNYHPLAALVDLAHSDSVKDKPEVQLEIHKAILPYVAPKLAAVEVKVEAPEDDRRIRVTLFEDATLSDGSQHPVAITFEEEISDVVPINGNM